MITGGVGLIPGATMNERRLHFIAHLDHIRRLLMNEPRGHSSMSGAILQPPSRPDCDYGVVYIEASGCLPMCGHGTMGVATVLVETGMVEVTEPRTVIRLDTPAGLVVADVEVRDGRAVSVTLENVASFTERLDASIGVEGLGEVPYSIAFGGNFYAMVDLDDVGLPFDRSRAHDILTAGLSIMDAINTTAPPKHPIDRGRQPRAPCGVHRTGFRRQLVAARDGDPPGLVRPFALRHRDLRADGRAVHPR